MGLIIGFAFFTLEIQHAIPNSHQFKLSSGEVKVSYQTLCCPIHIPKRMQGNFLESQMDALFRKMRNNYWTEKI